MNRHVLILLTLAAALAVGSRPARAVSAPDDQIQVPSWLAPYQADAQRLIAAAAADQFGWDRLAELTDTYGARFSGSDNLARAITWAADTMRKDGLQNVRTEKVMIPRWVRGRESLEILDPPHHVVPLLGLGGSVGTPPDGLEADVMVVSSMDELQKRSVEAKGRIVLFDVPYTNYGETVAYPFSKLTDRLVVGDAVGGESAAPEPRLTVRRSRPAPVTRPLCSTRRRIWASS